MDSSMARNLLYLREAVRCFEFQQQHAPETFRWWLLRLPLEEKDMSAEDALKLISDSKAKFVDFRFTDTHGKEQHVSVPASVIDA